MLDYDILSAYFFPISSFLEFWWAVILLLLSLVLVVVFGEKILCVGILCITPRIYVLFDE